MYKRKYLQPVVRKSQFYRRVAEENKKVFANLHTDNNFKSKNVNNVEYSETGDSCSNPNGTINELCQTDHDSVNAHIYENKVQLETHEPEIFEENLQTDFLENVEDNSKSYDTYLPTLQLNEFKACSNPVDLVSDLRNWAIGLNVPHHSVMALLKILAPYHPEIPLDSRTLLKTQRSVNLKKLDNGEYCHFGIEHV